MEKKFSVKKISEKKFFGKFRKKFGKISQVQSQSQKFSRSKSSSKGQRSTGSLCLFFYDVIVGTKSLRHTTPTSFLGHFEDYLSCEFCHAPPPVYEAKILIAPKYKAKKLKQPFLVFSNPLLFYIHCRYLIHTP